MARRRSSGTKKKHGTRAKPMLHKARRGTANKAQKKRYAWYKKHRAKILKKARAYYRKHRAKILRRAKTYRRLTKHGKKPFYKSGKVGGRYPRFKRLKRLNKYTRVGGKRKSSGRRRRRRA